ncbi:hypothetical protein C8J57DRAFT_1099457, partial [Mycena rebaudengoi]
TLLRHGYLGATPTKPSLAFPIRLFEVYRQIHRVCPRYSLDALSKTLTHLHMLPRKSTLAEQLSTGYNAYLEILRQVELRSQTALHWDAAWYINNVCAPCLYKTTNEPKLKYSILACMDGNNSLKLVDSTFRSGTPRADNRSSTSWRWLSSLEVDAFKDEVVNSQKSTFQPMAVAPNIRPDNHQTKLPLIHPLAKLQKCVNTCVERWRNAGPEARKKMFALFAISGIFLSVCRHGHVLVMCDMIRSGELMKYPLATVKRILDLYGDDVMLSYDIMCAFFKTLLRSSFGSRVVALRLRGVVPAFHGHAHNRACQIGWHPLYVEGCGLEDFEECERTFCKSNHLASVTRLSTPFHRQQQIDEHFHFHDLDKHASSGNFIYQKYRQALEKIRENTAKLSVLEERLGTTASDYEADLLAEAQYFEDLKTEPPIVQQTFQRLDHNIINNGYTGKEIQYVHTRYRTTHTKLLAVEEEVCRFEEEMGIETRWTPASKEYNDALLLMSERRYRNALSELERLIVQRLCELTKLGMSGVGYKMRDQIGKALKTRAEAIRRALQAYNDAAGALNPPREHMTWAEVIHTTSLAEFDLLRDTRQDVRKLAWTQPARREAAVLYFGIKSAKEEILRLNVEIRRLITHMVDEHVDYYRAIAPLIFTLPYLAQNFSEKIALPHSYQRSNC